MSDKEELKTKSTLNDKQLQFAQWLAVPPNERSPKLQQTLAETLGVDEHTLVNWKKNPDVLQAVNLINIEKMLNLVPPAIALIEKAITRPDSVTRVSYDAAQAVVRDWAQRTQNKRDDIANSIVEIYKKYN